VSDKKKLEEELLKINKKIDYQVNMIIELKQKVEGLRKEKEKQRDEFIEIDEIEKSRHDELEKSYKELYSKFENYESIEDLRENEIINSQMKIFIESKEKEDMEM
jgi:hypothetical protein